jgi:hypothetical protein
MEVKRGGKGGIYMGDERGRGLLVNLVKEKENYKGPACHGRSSR